MADHVVLVVDPLPGPSSSEQTAASETKGEATESAGPSYSSSNDGVDGGAEELGALDEEAALLQKAECRICQEEDSVRNLEMPCACSGSLKYAHRKCIQHWCNEKGDTACEICRQTYEPGYTIPPRSLPPEDTAIDIGGSWTISGTPLDLHDPRLLTMSETEHHFLEAEYDEYAANNASGAACCRSAALILMALLLLRHALDVTDTEGDDETTTFFSLFLLRAAGFLLPCYIMAWAISILQRRQRRQQEAAALAATHVAFVFGQGRGLQFTIASGPPPPSPASSSSPQESV